MNEHGLPLTRRSLIAGMGVTAGVAAWPTGVAGARPVRGTGPVAGRQGGPFGGLYSTDLHYTSLAAIAFAPTSSTTAWTSANGTLTGVGEFLVSLSPGQGDGLREFDVVVESAGQAGTVTVTRYPFYSPGASEVLGTSSYTAAPGRQAIVVHLDHTADPPFSTYVASVALQPGVILHGAVLWYFPLAGGLVLVPPQRVYDSRTTDGKITSGEIRSIETFPALEANTPSALFNVTLDQTEGRGFLTLFAPIGENGTPPPGTSSINWYGTDQIVANLAVSKLGGDHGNAVNVLAGGPGRTHFLIDVLGYFG